MHELKFLYARQRKFVKTAYIFADSFGSEYKGQNVILLTKDHANINTGKTVVVIDSLDNLHSGVNSIYGAVKNGLVCKVIAPLSVHGILCMLIAAIEVDDVTIMKIR